MLNNGLLSIDMREQDGYEYFQQSIINHFNSLVDEDTPIFTTDAESLWEIYLDNLPSEGRQYYNCNCCRHFIQRYGNLVVVTEEGVVESVMWSREVPMFFKDSINKLRTTVNKSRITGIFTSDIKTLGTPKTGIWSHIHITLPNKQVNRSMMKTAYQITSEKLEEYRMINRALQEYSSDTVNQALQLLQTETLYRGDNCLGVAKWFKNLRDDRSKAGNSRIRENITWVYIAMAPTGYCHIKSSMIGTLLDDISSGMSFYSVSRRFAEKTNPLNYMRSQVAPSQGNIEQAERIVEKLGIANSLRRRYAKFEEIPSFIWKNNHHSNGDVEVSKKGVFANITAKGTSVKDNNINLPSSVMTWDKFQRTILPTAENIEVMVDSPNRLMALVTAHDETCENILQWGNPFSWYYHGGVDAEIKRRVEVAGGRYENNEIRCSLIWEGLTDLDLHCITPKGEEVRYSNKRGRCGGWLDLDMNGIDKRSQTPVENMRWSTNAPQGRYKFFVHNYSERVTHKGTPFKVELEVNGRIYHYYGNPLTNGQKEVVFEFDYAKGCQLNINTNSVLTTDDWNIRTNNFVKVNGVVESPNLWGENKVIRSGSHVFFLLDGCKDSSEGKGRGFFNEMLKSELHEIRKTLEAYTANTPIEGIEESSACGVGYSKDSEWNLTLRITSNNSTRLIKIDRWD